MGVISAGIKYTVITTIVGLVALVVLSSLVQGMAGDTSREAIEQLDQGDAVTLLAVMAGIGALGTGVLARAMGWGRSGILGWFNAILGVWLAGIPGNLITGLLESQWRNAITTAYGSVDQFVTYALSLNVPALTTAEGFTTIVGLFILEAVIYVVTAGAVIHYLWRWE